MDELTDTERALLDFEGRSFAGAGAKEQAVRAEFGWSATGYYQRLNGLLGRAAALEYAPVLVNRLRRQRSAARRSRSARRGDLGR